MLVPLRLHYSLSELGTTYDVLFLAFD
uniref:Uncharacterized protein n=1 Tax=Arundo donax TaxID=35708 RepID=A0A0A9GPE1_ARUDO